MKKEEKYFGIQPKTFEMIFVDKDNLEKEDIENEKNIIIDTINIFTRLNYKNIFTSLLIKFYSHKYKIELEKIKYNEVTKQYEYILNNEVITFNMISNLIKEKELIKELKSFKRFGKCHERSYQQAHNIEGAKITTGIIKTGDKKVLHTIIEVPRKDATYVLDWTQNIYLKKENYIELYNFLELSSFDAQEVFYDMKIMEKMKVLDIGMKPYLSFRNEFIKDLEKNIHLLSEQDQEEIKNIKR